MVNSGLILLPGKPDILISSHVHHNPTDLCGAAECSVSHPIRHRHHTVGLRQQHRDFCVRLLLLQLSTNTSRASVGLSVHKKIIICPIAIAYSIGQIVRPVCLCPCVRLRALSRSHFLMDFHQN